MLCGTRAPWSSQSTSAGKSGAGCATWMVWANPDVARRRTASILRRAITLQITQQRMRCQKSEERFEDFSILNDFESTRDRAASRLAAIAGVILSGFSREASRVQHLKLWPCPRDASGLQAFSMTPTGS